MMHECWLPELEYFEDYQNSWEIYENARYDIFREDFVNDRPEFEGQSVKFRWHPIEYGKPEAFFHLTCQDYSKAGERVPDLRRCERIRWVRAFIENYHCDPSLCEDCDGVKVWREPYKSKERVHILLEEERYLVILEPRHSYCLLITAFYLQYDHALRKQRKHYEQYK